MPNWTSNEVRFKSRINSKHQLDKLKKRIKGVEHLVELASGEKTKEWNDFDFNKIHKMPKALEDTVSPTQNGDEKKAEKRLKKYGSKNWYDWKCKNWGTKWNSIDTEIVEDEREGLTYMSEKESDRQGWSSRPIEITLSNGVLLVPMQDDEGNDGGSIATSVAELPTIPTI